MDTQNKETYIQFASIGGTYVDLSNIDLSPWGIKGGFLENKETEDFINSISMQEHSEQNWERIKNVSQGFNDGVGKKNDWEYMNLLWPIDIDNPPSEFDYF